ncbi:MAG: choline dehydrogenase [Burkholderiales bacterium]|nr:choline dehydrogenase [Burkholderiales bacterium]
MDYDYIIVGAGSAGCVLANRLTADGQHRVLLLEAGPRDTNPWIHIPLGYGKLFATPSVNWMYQSEPEAELNNRRVFTPRGKVLGGCSSINGLVHVRGQAEDFDTWAAQGNAGWSFREVLPYFLRSENRVRAESEFQGREGPLSISELPDKHPLCDAFIEAAGALGIARNDDFNGAKQEGAGYYHTTSRKGRRASCAVAYLRPALGRTNLDVRTEALTTRIRFHGGHAVGVEYRMGGSMHIASARREVIVSAGTFNSPQLLQLSGIGPRALLERHGIAVLRDIPGVGGGLQDHFYVRTVWKCTQPITINDAMASLFGRLGMGLRYALMRRGPLTVSAGYAGAFVRSNARVTRPDVQLYFINFSTDRMGTGLHPFSAFTASMSPLRPQSRGSVRIRSADPAEAPAIHYNYLNTPDDQRTVVAGLQLVRRIMSTAPMRPYVLAEHAPGSRVQSEAQWLDYAREVGGTVYHPTSTCRMGQDPLAVVDARLRVRGVPGLRVVDASVMPGVVSGNTNAATVMVAEKGADMILGDARAAQPARAA